MAKEFKKVTLLVRDEEINLKCPICGCEEFYKKEYIADPGSFRFITTTFYYVCKDCTHMITFDEPKEKPAPREEKDPVAEYEEIFKNYSEGKLRKIIESDKYFDAPKKAARNLLAKK